MGKSLHEKGENVNEKTKKNFGKGLGIRAFC